MQFAVRLMSCVIVSFLGMGVKFYKIRVGIYMDVIEGTARPWVGGRGGGGCAYRKDAGKICDAPKNSPALPYQ